MFVVLMFDVDSVLVLVANINVMELQFILHVGEVHVVFPTGLDGYDELKWITDYWNQIPKGWYMW